MGESLHGACTIIPLRFSAFPHLCGLRVSEADASVHEESPKGVQLYLSERFQKDPVHSAL